MEMGEFGDVRYIRDSFGGKRMGIGLYIYLVDGLLVDTGPAKFRKRYIPFFASERIEQVGITHLHEDHAGSAAWIARNLGVPIYAHPDALEEASRDAELGWYRRLYWGQRKAFTAHPFGQTLETDNHRFKVIATPGHTDTHIVLHERERGWLFSGDMYVAPRQKLALKTENMNRTIESLETLLSLDFDTVFCAHAGVVEQGKESLRKKRDFLVQLREEVNAYRKTGLTDKEINRRIFPKKKLVYYFSCGEVDSRFVIETLR